MENNNTTEEVIIVEVIEPTKVASYQSTMLDFYEPNQDLSSGKIKLSNNLIRGSNTFLQDATPNSLRVEDACIFIYQSRELFNHINYNKLHGLALKKLESKFLEYDLIESPENSIKRNAEIAKMREVEIDNFIKSELANQLPKTIVMNPKELIKETKIHRIQNRFNEALLLLSQSSKSITRSWTSQRVDYINDKSNKKAVLKNVLTQGSIVPKFKLVFSDKLKKVLTQEQIMNLTIESFIDLKLVNKSTYVDEIVLIPDAETIIEIAGVGLFNSIHGKGFSSAERKNRAFKKKYTFPFDMLVRSLINLPKNHPYTFFTLEELRVKLSSSIYTEWELFKRYILLPVLQDQIESSEIKCDYALVPNHKNWTHIKLIPSWQNTKLGFEAEKGGFDYLAYFMAVQHKYFQKNKLKDSLETFIAHVQSQIYNTSHEKYLYGKTLSEWIEYTRKIYTTEKELLTFIENNPLLLAENNVFYDERIMCLLKINTTQEEQLDTLDSDTIPVPIKKNKNHYIKGVLYNVTDPISSYRYLNELLSSKNEQLRHNIYDFIPFQFATIDEKWHDIYTIVDYSKLQDLIKSAIFKKRTSLFRFGPNESGKKEKFLKAVNSLAFEEIDNQFKELMISLG